MSAPRKVLVKYTGKEKKLRTMVGLQEFAEWNNGDVYEVLESKVRNHIKYPFFELADEGSKPKQVKVDEPKPAKKSKSVEKREKIQKEAEKEEVEEKVVEEPEEEGEVGEAEKEVGEVEDEVGGDQAEEADGEKKDK